MAIKSLPRVFEITVANKKIQVPDPNPALTPKEALKLIAIQYPTVSNSTIGSTSIKADKIVYTVGTTLGTKG